MKKLTLTFLVTLALMSCSVQNQVSTKTPAELNVMTFNIRLDHQNDNENNWKFRQVRVANSVSFYEADRVGMQEVLHNQLLDIRQTLKNYNYI